MPVDSQHNVMLFLPLIVFCNDTATTEIYTLSLHDALPIWIAARRPRTTSSARSRPRSGTCGRFPRSEEHTSELQSPYVTSDAVVCLKKTSRTVIVAPPSSTTGRWPWGGEGRER